MNRPLRHVWLVVAVLFLTLFGSTTYIQVFQAKSLNADSRNARTMYNEFGRDRGPLVVGGSAVADSVPSDDSYGYQRQYADGPMYAPVTGYYSVVYGFSGLENALNDTLSGEADSLFYQRMADIVSGRTPQGATVELTIDPAAQEAAYDALDGQRGAAVALDPETGAVLAMVSTPSYDPAELASHDRRGVRDAWQRLSEDPEKPLTNRAIGGGLYPPGSTFKLLVAAAALDSGSYTKDSVIPGPGSYTLPGSSSVMSNHSGGNQDPCGPGGQSSLQDALRQSCNTSFAMLGISLGEDELAKTVEEYGFGQKMSIPLRVTPSTIGTDLDDAQLATTSIGQYEDRVTPLQMAMVAASFDNDGQVMKPQLVQSVRTSSLKEVSSLTPEKLSQPLSASNAAQMREMMQAVVTDGTGEAAQIDGAEVGGKTGTAQWGEGRDPHAWFVGYANKGDRKVAVAVVVEEGGYGSDAAAPIAQDIMKAVVSP
ncbi:peptidoglycan D,D-transpeptidase FtsI family protein [Brachybacterium nesterenkovii]|uniref:peptidoglycan D,D-transpeptidase FtsI family protein n=1 Tax=Brachybacterium nesterenkovii TaxID=47847 RepID=UPI00321A22E0